MCVDRIWGFHFWFFPFHYFPSLYISHGFFGFQFLVSQAAALLLHLPEGWEKVKLVIFTPPLIASYILHWALSAVFFCFNRIWEFYTYFLHSHWSLSLLLLEVEYNRSDFHWTISSYSSKVLEYVSH